MSTLFHRRYLACPYDRARYILAETLQDLAESGRPVVQRLRVQFPSADGDGASVEKDVIVTYGVGNDPLHFDQPWAVHWMPANGGPFPEFDGTLTVRADEDYTTCALELRGNYEPPLGIPGALFDTVLGSRIASATAREFLKEIGTRIETRYRAEEAAKASR
ncbi:MAG: hypothetical protein JO322_14675 [Candidatus Eremiobacteraeota bacterium]|nr:hypothetical protein [Candidatus Eremiobacteraeota bacterium]